MNELLGRARAQDAAGRAWYRLRQGDRSALTELIRLAKDGNPQAQLYIGYLLDNGEFVAQDSKAAAAYFTAAAPHNPIAKYDLGLLYMLGRGVPQDEKRALQLFTESHKESNLEYAGVRLAQHFLKEKNWNEAWRFGESAANLGNSFGFFTLGLISFQRRDYRTAANWLSKAAQAGDKNAPRYLTQLYATAAFPEANPVISGMWKIIDDVMNGRSASPGVGGVAGLSVEDVATARSLARDWLGNHGRPQKLQYSKTIYEPPSRSH
ncbi:tetratricopeptide repeat protein [Rubrivivax gelatinosus]|uniref:tetratricopeptide repeat protein n=1 Tax=Rubrivivax gelatinosus TaxID=28068 RepID=UPI0005C1BE1A|nr:tetratricopeptide repeat protein [Rubrivivax gelatinosus]MBG6082992.1 TPR repeat protein [Rubrivivax gelatinosus]